MEARFSIGVCRERMTPNPWRYIRLAIEVAFYLSLGFSGVSFAQSSATQSRSISIGIASTWLSAYVNRPLDFGTVVAGSGAHNVALTDFNTGKVTISGFRFFPVYVTLTPPPSLVSTNGLDSLSYSPAAAYNSMADNPSGATVWSTPSGTENGIYLSANPSGWYGYAYVYLYGSINVTNVPPGAYSGTYTVSVSYW